MSIDDLTPFFNTAEFAVSATWSESSKPVDVIFDDSFSDPLGISSSVPTATANAAHMPNVARGQTLVIKGVTYKIDDIQPDGTGLIDLILKKA